MEKNREPLTVFRWRKDAAGYALSSDRRRIERRGGALVEYDPAKVTPPLHRTFAKYLGQVKVFDELRRAARAVLSPIANLGTPEFLEMRRELAVNLTDDPTAPFHQRRFPDEESLFLAFVSEYGFLGSDRSRADAEFEDVDYLASQAHRLDALASGARTLKEIEIGSTAVAGPTLRMYLSPGPRNARMEVHYEPESLYAWMWLRTADDFSTGVKWDGPPCLFCLTPIGRGPGHRRTDAKFCENMKCKTYFGRLSAAERKKRKAEAHAYARNQQGA